MAVFLKAGICRALESNLRYANQVRCYARWSHRQPRKVFTSEEYDKIEERYQKHSKINIEKPSSLSEDRVIVLNAESDVIQKNLKVNVKRSSEPKNRKGAQLKTKNDVVEKQTKLEGEQSKHKWTPKSLEPHIGIINMKEVDMKSEPIHYKIDPKFIKKKNPKYKTKKDNPQTATDMLETVIDANGECIYTKLKDNDPSIGQLLLTVKSRREQIKKDLALLEGKKLIKEALDAKCILKNLIFSRKSDIEYLKPYLPKSGAKLYKMPYKEIQMWSDLTTTPGIMGIFKTPDVENFTPDCSLALTIICDNIREPGNLGAILRSAAGVGAQSVILTKGCVDLWDTKVLRSACGAHFSLQIHKKMDWPDIMNHLNDSRSTVLIADNKIVTENVLPNLQNDGESPELPSNQDPSNKVSTLRDIIASVPLLPYYSVNFGDLGHLTLIVGGESEGLSEESYRLAASFNGVRLNIPLRNNLDSLNTGTALGVIMFEIKRQMALFQCKTVDVK